MKAVVAAFNQEKALVGAFSVITNLRMELFEALVTIRPPITAHLAVAVHAVVELHLAPARSQPVPHVRRLGLGPGRRASGPIREEYSSHVTRCPPITAHLYVAEQGLAELPPVPQP